MQKWLWTVNTNSSTITAWRTSGPRTRPPRGAGRRQPHGPSGHGSHSSWRDWCCSVGACRCLCQRYRFESLPPHPRTATATGRPRATARARQLQRGSDERDPGRLSGSRDARRGGDRELPPPEDQAAYVPERLHEAPFDQVVGAGVTLSAPKRPDHPAPAGRRMERAPIAGMVAGEPVGESAGRGGVQTHPVRSAAGHRRGSSSAARCCSAVTSRRTGAAAVEKW